MKVSAKIIGEIEHLIDTAYEALEDGDSTSSRNSRQKRKKSLRKGSQENSRTVDNVSSNHFETNMDISSGDETAKQKLSRSLSPAQKAFVYSEILNRKY